MANIAATFDSTDAASPGYYGPAQTALLLLDFHALFVQRIGGANAAAAFTVATQIRKWAKSQGIVVVHCLVDVNSTPSPTCKGIEKLSSFLNMLKAGEAEEPKELLEDSDNNDVHFTRTLGFVSALKSPGLPDFLQKKGIKSLVLCGLSTSGCVMKTAFPATDAEYVVTVISDACADPREGVHELVVETLLPSRAYVTTAAEFQEGYTRVESGK